MQWLEFIIEELNVQIVEFDYIDVSKFEVVLLKFFIVKFDFDYIIDEWMEVQELFEKIEL